MTLVRRLGTTDAVLVGLGAMLGAGVFAALAPAARAAGGWLLAGLAVAAVVAGCNAMSSARLAALYPESGGTYVYGRRRLGPFWGYLAGWAFVVGKTASCAAMALTFASYAFPGWERPAAVAAVAALTALNWRGVHKSALATRVIVAVVLAVLAAVVVAGLSGPTRFDLAPTGPFHLSGVLQAAGLLFFAFAGYARIATLGEEVRDPARTIPRAIGVALGGTLVVYALVAATALTVLGPDRLAAETAPLAATVTAAGAGWLVPVVRVGAAVAALGSLLALILGVSRTTFAMARDRHLPGFLAATHPRFHVPHRAEAAVGLVVAVLAATVDLRGAIGFSSFGVLLYYAVANAAALTLPGRSRTRVVGVLGFVGCLVLAATLPRASVFAGLVVLGIGAALYLVTRSRAADAGPGSPAAPAAPAAGSRAQQPPDERPDGDQPGGQ
ncbi:amino acid permease [Longispora sp. K20-0274]|uniref:APC family permease n=1 Tax=Longispora sp. K20-0274 TaxID=3088255 RepID=UPI00399B6292